MSDFHQQAIEDVARATNWSSDDIKLFIAQAGTEYDDGSDKAFAYAVAQRERVLELEAIVTGLLRIYRDGDSPREDHWIPIMEAAFPQNSAPEKAKP